jgi:hypothetical protein
MNRRTGEDRLYTAVLAAFLIALVGLGTLGVPAPLVAAIGLAAAALAITAGHRFLGRRAPSAEGRPAPRGRVPRQYVPSVLEGAPARRRRGVHLRRRRNPHPPLRFR